jgi:hypothetical protein
MLVNTVSSVVVGAKYVNGSKYDVIYIAVARRAGETKVEVESPERISAHGPPHDRFYLSNTSFYPPRPASNDRF